MTVGESLLSLYAAIKVDTTGGLCITSDNGEIVFQVMRQSCADMLCPKPKKRLLN